MQLRTRNGANKPVHDPGVDLLDYRFMLARASKGTRFGLQNTTASKNVEEISPRVVALDVDDGPSPFISKCPRDLASCRLCDSPLI